MPLLSPSFRLAEHEYVLTAVRSAGPGGQSVNKVATAVQLRFDIRASSLPPDAQERVLAYRDKRISKDGVILIKAQRFKSQLKNREDAVERLHRLLHQACRVERTRKATKPTRSSVEKRLKGKQKRSATKKMRGRISRDDY
ncbi:MAG: alternative ribosome rescue aminoacyl-tRNA hydrolase ArfB [Bacteroidota bacterium]